MISEKAEAFAKAVDQMAEKYYLTINEAMSVFVGITLHQWQKNGGNYNSFKDALANVVRQYEGVGETKRTEVN